MCRNSAVCCNWEDKRGVCVCNREVLVFVHKQFTLWCKEKYIFWVWDRPSFIFLQKGTLVVPVVCVCVCVCVYVQLLSCVQLFATLWTVACQAPQSMKFSQQEHWSGLPFPSLGDLPNSRIKPTFPTLLHYRWSLYCWVTREICFFLNSHV